MVISQTPYRISFFGGGTDYRPYFMEHGGSVLSTTIDRYCYLTLRRLPPFFDHASRLSYSKIELFNSADQVQHPAVRECLKFMDLRGVSVTHDGDLPARAGLGTSSAFTVGLLNAMHALKGEFADPMTLASEAIHVEQDMIGENVGVQDQLAAAIGGLNRLYFRADGYDYRPVILKPERRQRLDENLMLFFTGIFRYASQIAEEQVKNTQNKLHELREMTLLTEEGEKTLVSGDINDFGRLLHEGWQLKRSFSGRISTEEIDRMYSRAREAGALGGKLLGAGGGGFLLFYVEKENQEFVKRALKELLYVPFHIGQTGSRIVYSTPPELHPIF